MSHTVELEVEDSISSSPSLSGALLWWYFEPLKRWNLVLRILQKRMHTQLLTLGYLHLEEDVVVVVA